MAVRTIVTKLSLEGESEYKSKMAGINNELKMLGSELKLVESEFKGNANSMEALAAKGDVLQKMYDEQNQKLSLYADRLNLAKEAQQSVANTGDELAASIRAQKDVIAEFEQAIKGSADGSIEFRDANGSLVRSIEDGAGEIARLKNELREMERALVTNRTEQQAAANTVSDYQQKVNTAKVKLNDFDSEVQQNKRYMDEASNSTDRCATSIDRYGKQTKEAAVATDDATKKGGLLSKIFAGGFFANIASTALSFVTSKIKELVSAVFKSADELKRLEAVTGLTTDKLQEFQYVGDNVGVGMETITSALKRLVNNMDMAKTGSGAAYDAFEALGVSFRDNVSGELLNSTEVFNNIIDALGRMTNETQRDALAQDLLGRSAAELNPLIEAGSAALRDMAEEAHNAGTVMSKDTVETLDEAGDSWANFVKFLEAKMGDALAAVYTFLFGKKKATFDEIDALDSLGKKIDTINDAYNSATTTSELALKKQIGLWDDLSGSVDKTFGELKTAVGSQLQWYENYTTNLANLSMRNIAGVDELVLKLSDGTKESAATVAGLATASDEQIMHLIDNMQEVDDRRANLARYMGQLKTDANAQLNALYAGMGDATQQLDASGKARVAAEKTMDGFLAGIFSKKQEVIDAYKEVSESSFFEGIIKAWQINSPSKVMQEAAAHIWDGMIMKTEQMRPIIAGEFSDTAARAEAATRQAIPQVVVQPQSDAASGTAAQIGNSISRALEGTVTSGITSKTIVLNLTAVTNLENRQIAKGVRTELIELNDLAGTDLFE
jgi:hypothetical protein